MLGNLILPACKPLFISSNCRFYSTETARSPRRVPLTSSRICMAFAEVDSGSATESRRSSNLYEVLQVKQSASPMEIKTAYRSLAKQYHPDSLHQSGSDCRGFIEIHDAYSTLSDPAARALYDLSLNAHRRRYFGYSVGNRTGFYRTRRWETDQCW